MSEIRPNSDAPETDANFAPITTQEDLNRVIADRLNRERAKYADYADLKKKAAAFDKAQNDQLSEIEKANNRAAEAEKRAQAAELASTRAAVAAEMGLPPEVLHGGDETAIREHAAAIAALRDQANAPRAPMADPAQGISAGQPSDQGNGDWLTSAFQTGGF